MTQVASIDFPNKRVYLHQDTVTQGFDAMAAHFEIKQIVQANLNNEQNFSSPMSAEGNIAKWGWAFTPRYVLLAEGWFWIPYDTWTWQSYSLTSSVEILSEDLRADRETFDRDNINAEVDFDPTYSQVEIIEVSGEWGWVANVDEIADAVSQKITEQHWVGKYNRVWWGGWLSSIWLESIIKKYFSDMEERILEAQKNKIDFTFLSDSISALHSGMDEIRADIPKNDDTIGKEILKKVAITEEYIEKKKKEELARIEKEKKRKEKVIKDALKTKEKNDKKKLKNILDKALLKDIIK